MYSVVLLWRAASLEKPRCRAEKHSMKHQMIYRKDWQAWTHLIIYLTNHTKHLNCLPVHCTFQRKRSAMLMTCTGGFARKSRHSLITSPTKDAVQKAVRCAHISDYDMEQWQCSQPNNSLPGDGELWLEEEWRLAVAASGEHLKISSRCGTLLGENKMFKHLCQLSEQTCVDIQTLMRCVKTVWARMWSAIMTVMMETSFR